MGATWNFNGGGERHEHKPFAAPARMKLRGPVGPQGKQGPQGEQGIQGIQGVKGDTGENGISPTVTVTTIAGGHTVTITDVDHPSGQTFDVMDGSGSGDMSASVYDPQSAVAAAGGIPDYVAAQGFAVATDLSAHTGDTNNPHGVTAAQVGLGNVPNVATNDQTPTFTQYEGEAQGAIINSGETLSTIFGKLKRLGSDFTRLQVSNLNLLDNSWFTVNQRGAVTLTSGFISDRWKIYNGTGVVNADKTITFTATQSDAAIYQNSPYRNNIVDKVVTLSIMYNDYTVESGTVTVAASGWRGFTLSSGIYLALDTINNKVQFVIGVPNGTTVTIRAVKLEVGSVSTLANDVAPNYDIELYKCKAYFQRIYFTSAWTVVALGFCDTATAGNIILNLSAPLRTIDNVNFSYSGSFNLYNGVISTSVTNITKVMNTPDNITLSCTATSLTPGTSIALITTTNGNYIDLSADL